MTSTQIRDKLQDLVLRNLLGPADGPQEVVAEVVATVLAPGVHRRGEVSQRTDLMDAARRAGQETVKG
jgi:hypothetical protein